MGKVINYYAGGNTAKGFYGLFESNMKGLERIYLLKGGPGTGKLHMIKKLANVWKEKDYDIELIHCASDNNSLDGLIIPKLMVGIFDATAPHVLEPTAPGAIEQYINLGEAWEVPLLEAKRKEILDYQHQIQTAFQTAYERFATGLSIHDDLEDIYINQMDIAAVNELTNTLIDTIFIGKQSKQGNSIDRHRFFGASTPKGVVDFIPNITEGLVKRYFIKGRAGTGKSTILKKIAAQALERKFDIEVYHCGFDPRSLDMVVIRELGICVFDSTDPHEYFPDRHGDKIVDVYEKAVTPGTDEKFHHEIADFTKRYKGKMKEGIFYLQEAKRIHDDLEKIYIEATDFTVLDQIFEKINDEINERV